MGNESHDFLPDGPQQGPSWQNARWPLVGGDFPWQGVIVLVAWLTVLVGVGALGYRRAIRTSRR